MPEETVTREFHDVLARDLEEAGPFALIKDKLPKATDPSSFPAWAETGTEWLLATSVSRAGAGDLSQQLLDECAGIAARQGFPPSEGFLQRTRAMLADAASPVTASLMRDLDNGGAVEADQILGDLFRRAKGGDVPLLRVVCGHLQAYEVRRGR